MAIYISAAVLHQHMDTIDGYGKNASPCPSEPLWLQGTLILERPGDLVIPDCQSRTPWAGVTTGYAELQNSMTVTLTSVSCKTQENRAKTGMEECCLKRWVKKELNSFWYSCQDLNFHESKDMICVWQVFGDQCGLVRLGN